MNKIFKYFSVSILTMFIGIALIIPVSAQEGKESVLYDMAEISEQELIDIAVEQYLLEKNLTRNDIKNLKIKKIEDDLFNPMLRYKKRKTGEETKWVDLEEAADQYPEGVIFQNGGSIYWQEGGHTVTVSASVGYKGASAGISVGKKAKGVTGYAMSCLPNKSCKMGVKKKNRFVGYHLTGWTTGSVELNDYITTKQVLQIEFYNML